MHPLKRKLLIVTFLVIIILIGSIYYLNSRSPPEGLIQVTIAVTADFGQELIQEESLTVHRGTSALDALKMMADVETIYGGGFVSSINGIGSGYPRTRRDWFFYVNGVLAKEGAANYVLLDRDLIQWDYHSWDTPSLQTATLGVYPYFFSKGYSGKVSPVIIAYEDDFLDEAVELQTQLRQISVDDLAMISINDLSETERASSNVIIIASYKHGLVAELNAIHDKIGFYAHYEEKVLYGEGPDNTRRAYTSCGIVQATQNIWNPKGNAACENIILLISGTDIEPIKRTFDTFLERPQKFRYLFGVIITAQGEYPLPLQQ